MLKAIFFDFDGVIIDSEPIYHKIFLKIKDKFLIKISDNDYNTLRGKSINDIKAFFIYKGLKEDTINNILRYRNNLVLDYFYNTKIPLIKGIQDFLNELKTKKIITAITSSATHDFIDLIIKKYCMQKFFHYIISSELIENSKPAPDIFLYGLKLLNILPENCIVIEDSYNGVKAAKTASLKCIGIYNDNKQDLSSADFIIDDFRTLNLSKLEEILE